MCRLENVPLAWGIVKSKGPEPQENRIINHFTKAVESDRETAAGGHPFLSGQESHVFSSPFSPQHTLCKYMETP